jgi:hypothetical protein
VKEETATPIPEKNTNRTTNFRNQRFIEEKIYSHQDKKTVLKPK